MTQEGEQVLCLCCGREPSECICWECPLCGQVGDPDCYPQHGMHYSKQQRRGQVVAAIEQLDRIERTPEMELYLAWLDSSDQEWFDDDNPLCELV